MAQRVKDVVVVYPEKTAGVSGTSMSLLLGDMAVMEKKDCHDDTTNDDDDDDDDTRNKDGICTQQLDRLLIEFRVRRGYSKDTASTNTASSSNRNNQIIVDTEGSGADDGILVVGVKYLGKHKK
jgi:hypothetical protein